MPQSGLFGFPIGHAASAKHDGTTVVTSTQNIAWPDGVWSCRAYVQAGGAGGTNTVSSSAGGDSSISYAGQTYTANGGNAAGPANYSSGGNGDISIAGRGSEHYKGGDSFLGAGGSTTAGIQGGGGGGEQFGGGAGECVIVRIVRNVGENYLSCVVGAGGAIGNGTSYVGGAGLIYIEWNVANRSA